MVGGMCGILPFGAVCAIIRLYTILKFVIVSVHSFLKQLKKKSGIDISDESPRYQHVLAVSAYFFFFNKGDVWTTNSSKNCV